jgi:steroid 5-alpha reductase family enzyme
MITILYSLAMVWLWAATIMVLLWFVQRRTGNAGIVDAGWAAAIGSSALFLAVGLDGDIVRRIALALMGGVWGLRLAVHIHHRSHGKPEDGRYQQLRREWGNRVQSRMFRFYQLQALTVAFFALPFALAAHASAPFGLIDAAALLLWLLAMTGESVADAQLERFKNTRRPGETVCRAGLWRLSRHPNYFFEWLNWCSFSLLAISAAGGAWGLLAPAAMLYLLLGVTGIPATEAQALRSKGDAYRDYQRTTSAFVPWFPRGE